jgi:hypothetical protein
MFGGGDAFDHYEYVGVNPAARRGQAPKK